MRAFMAYIAAAVAVGLLCGSALALLAALGVIR